MTKQQSNFLDLLSEWVLNKNCIYFERQQLVNDGEFMSSMTNFVTESKTPDQQVSALLQDVRDMGIIEFLDEPGSYRVKNYLV